MTLPLSLIPTRDLHLDYDNCVATGRVRLTSYYNNRGGEYARKTEPESHIHPCALLAKNPYPPASTLAQAIMHSSALLTDLVVAQESERGLIKEPDPDAMYRSDGRSSAADDAQMNNGGDDGIDDAEEAEGWQGNPRRKL
ncbi:hypothetical protein DFJ58DRAFT_848753 [Suillus subalutaceus]|uniref:uncharacterized protein n=1 Tax=Suillus subalutaceus TaxID=48586 RepID=UPI001B87BF86|nr:uncharacterized protein DFJ58DRAFT_848753 [Suillus subalutaceus]KAG1829382.1 hypothetical protein DFJ58DRAFT_848753 [Suillus subalutaceus]